MKYLVTMELIGTPPDSPGEILRFLEEKVVPTNEAFLKLEAEKKILAGGDLSGRRGSVFIVEAASNAEVTQLLATLPLWASQEVEVIPLDSFEERQEMHRRLCERLRAAT